MTTIIGNIIDGLGAASMGKEPWGCKGSIELQMKYFEKNHKFFYYKICNCYFGTINIEVDDRKSIYNNIDWDYKFYNIAWIPNTKKWFEDIYFKRININFNDSLFNSWLYYASKSPHQKNQNSNLIEVLAPYIPKSAINKKIILSYFNEKNNI